MVIVCRPAGECRGDPTQNFTAKLLLMRNCSAAPGSVRRRLRERRNAAESLNNQRFAGDFLTHSGCCNVLLWSHMILLILPVISGEEERGVCSNHKKQRKNLQVDQEEGFKQRGDIIGLLQEEMTNKFGSKKVFQWENIKRSEAHDKSLPDTLVSLLWNVERQSDIRAIIAATLKWQRRACRQETARLQRFCRENWVHVEKNCHKSC